MEHGLEVGKSGCGREYGGRARIVEAETKMCGANERGPAEKSPTQAAALCDVQTTVLLKTLAT